jgi:hypothetical protein
LVVGAGIAANTFITAGSYDTWTVSVNQTTNTQIPAKIYRQVWIGKAYIAGTTLQINSTVAGKLSKDNIIIGPGISSAPNYTYIESGSDKSWTVDISQNVGTLGSPITMTAYELSWSGLVSTTNGQKELKIILTTPVTVNPSGVPGALSVQTQGVSLDSLCAQKHKLLPPIDICGFTNPIFPNTYYSKPALGATGSEVCSKRPARPDGSYYITSRPEYYFWPQFVNPDEDYKTYWNTLY